MNKSFIAVSRQRGHSLERCNTHTLRVKWNKLAQEFIELNHYIPVQISSTLRIQVKAKLFSLVSILQGKMLLFWYLRVVGMYKRVIIKRQVFTNVNVTYNGLLNSALKYRTQLLCLIVLTTPLQQNFCIRLCLTCLALCCAREFQDAFRTMFDALLYQWLCAKLHRYTYSLYVPLTILLL